MARPRSHDEQRVRAKAMEAFRRSGFDGTSLSDLEAATGIGRRQLYNRFGDKRGIFLQAILDFEAVAAGVLLSDLEAPEADLKDVQAALPLLVRRAAIEGDRLGCLLCNTACESIGVNDEEIRGRILDFWGRIDSAYVHALSNAVARDQVRLTRQQTTRVARRFRAAHISLCLMMRSGEHTSVLVDFAKDASASSARTAP